MAKAKRSPDEIEFKAFRVELISNPGPGLGDTPITTWHRTTHQAWVAAGAVHPAILTAIDEVRRAGGITPYWVNIGDDQFVICEATGLTEIEPL